MSNVSRTTIEYHEYIINIFVGVISGLYLLYILFYKSLSTYNKLIAITVIITLLILSITMGKPKYYDIVSRTHIILWFTFMAIVFSNSKYILLFGLFYGLCMLFIWEWNGGCSLGSHDPSGEGGKGVIGNLVGSSSLLATMLYCYKLARIQKCK
tara:strand:+ start:226 stop:687 length:462 start_codon:yes stop_codon:yes gene_type:complete